MAQGSEANEVVLLTCPSCQARIKVRARPAGRTLPCPRCRTHLTVGAPAGDFVEDLAAAILTEGEAAAKPSAAPRKPISTPAPRPTAAPAPQGERLKASQRAEQSLQALLTLAEGRGEKAAYLVALTFLKDINRLAADGMLGSEKASRVVRQFALDQGKDEHVRNCLVAGGPLIPPGSPLTLRESHDLFRKQVR